MAKNSEQNARNNPKPVGINGLILELKRRNTLEKNVKNFSICQNCAYSMAYNCSNCSSNSRSVRTK
uniref:Uncharacterized protein n=2 Tax=Meloidogyne TaxID=189290 RepID=A0A6V7UD51_MELEN|nr:unnamed protein product [Meloidogyne enterolobii]